jgi:DNA-binding transcriptional MerR regulator
MSWGWVVAIMLSIGDLARHTGLTVRMLRHYDELGLVTPVRVDEDTGYRWYTASQVGRVDALVALKELGFSLARCREILDEQVSAEELRDLLRHRQTELAERIDADTARLAEVGRRLRSIERGLTMTNRTLEIRPLPALRLAQVSGHVNDTTEIPAAVADLVDRLSTHLRGTGPAERGVDVPRSGIRTFYGHPDGTRIDVAVGIPLTRSDEDGEVEAIDGLEVVDLPAVETAAVVVHRGPASEIAEAWRTFDVATDQHGLTPYGVHRQVSLDAGHGDEVVVELQCPVRPSAEGC